MRAGGTAAAKFEGSDNEAAAEFDDNDDDVNELFIAEFEGSDDEAVAEFDDNDDDLNELLIAEFEGSDDEAAAEFDGNDDDVNTLLITPLILAGVEGGNDDDTCDCVFKLRFFFSKAASRLRRLLSCSSSLSTCFFPPLLPLPPLSGAARMAARDSRSKAPGGCRQKFGATSERD